MVMLGSVNATVKMKDRLMSLADSFSDDSLAYDSVVDAAVQFRDSLKGEAVIFSMAEKLQVLKSLTRAKVRALRSGKQDDYRTFKALDAISGDLVQML
jgi:hypothetical protein